MSEELDPDMVGALAEVMEAETNRANGEISDLIKTFIFV